MGEKMKDTEIEKRLDIIYRFGKEVIVQARDVTIHGSLSILDGTANAPSYKKMFKKMEELTFSREQKEYMLSLIIDSIDGAINNLIWMMEENNDKYAFWAKCADGTQFDIEQESDGLCVGQWEFIDEFSQYNTADEFLETGRLEKVQEESN